MPLQQSKWVRVEEVEEPVGADTFPQSPAETLGLPVTASHFHEPSEPLGPLPRLGDVVAQRLARARLAESCQPSPSCRNNGLRCVLMKKGKSKKAYGNIDGLE
jgi:hypothetical protein